MERPRAISAKLRAGLLLVFLTAGWAGCGNDGFRDFTGAPARVVWCQQVDEGSDDAMARTSRFRLMGWDSEDGKGARPLLDEIRNYHKPLLSPDGQTVVFSDWGERRFYAVEWTGANLRPIGPGMAVDVWMEPKSGTQWVYAITREHYWERFRGTMLARFRLDDPSVYQLVWEQSVVSADNFQLSRNGHFAGGVFPWPNGGVADLIEKTLSTRGRGCWASLAPDDSRVYWLFDGAHRNLVFYSPDGSASWKVNINQAPGVEGHEVYHPRWSNHARYFAMTGPYTVKVEGKNAIHGGGDDVEIYIGRFGDDARRVDAWMRLTDNSRGDFYPDLWVEGGADSSLSTFFPQVEKSGTPVNRASALIEAELVQATPVPDPKSIEPYVHALVFSHYRVEQVVEGALDKEQILVGHWGIRDGAVLPVPSAPGQRIRLLVEPLEAHPELDAERQLIEVDDLTLPAFVTLQLPVL